MSEYDFTHNDEAFAVSDRRFMIFTAGQVVEFGEAVYLADLVISKVEDEVVTPLVLGVDYTNATADTDLNAMSDAKLRSEGFSSTLLKSITMIHWPGAEYQISVDYQRLTLDELGAGYLNPDGPEPTPALMRELLATVEFLKNVKDPLSVTLGESSASATILDMDLTASLEDNYILEESHAINTLQGRQAIAPTYGSFYKQDLVVTLDGEALVYGDDYIVLGANLGKQRLAETTSKVFDYLLITKAITGDVKVTYRAFGGEITPADLNHLRNVINNLEVFLQTSSFLTANTLGGTDIITAILDRIESLETYIRHYPVFLHTIEHTDTDIHWFSIAELNKSVWDENVRERGIGHYRVESNTKGWLLDFDVTVNLSNIKQPFALQNMTYMSKYDDVVEEDYEQLYNRVVPVVRIIWNNDAGTLSGAILQVGVVEPDASVGTPVQDVLRVTDGSIIGSMWYPRIATSEALTGEDDVVELPDGNDWTIDSGTDMQAVTIATPTTGYIAWKGVMPCNEIIVPTTLNHLINGDSVDISAIKQVKVSLFDRYTNSMVQAIMQVAEGSLLLYGFSMFYVPDLCAIALTIEQDAGTPSTIVMTIQSFCGTSSITNDRFDLHQISLFS